MRVGSRRHRPARACSSFTSSADRRMTDGDQWIWRLKRCGRVTVQKPWDNGLIADAADRDREGRVRRQTERSARARQLDVFSASCCRRRSSDRRLRTSGVLAAGGWSRWRLLRRDCIRPSSSCPVDRRCRRQGYSRSAVNVEPPGRRARICHRGDVSCRTLSAGQSDPVRQHRRRALHQL